MKARCLASVAAHLNRVLGADHILLPALGSLKEVNRSRCSPVCVFGIVLLGRVDWNPGH